MNPKRQHDRRTFLHLAIGAAACSACADAAPASAPRAFGDVSAGTVSALQVGSIVAIRGISACIARDARGLYAMTLTCTHAGCDMSSRGTISKSGIVCNCHGSEFDDNGAVVAGPASAPLQHFEVTVDAGGAITVHGGSPVEAAVRVPVA
ncbi:MAG TPA: Rieske (2Fe-2S) protein [Labilithrix sp.]|nr:Rieske (2Fe-2S) protein [Labilithrix sp.]